MEMKEHAGVVQGRAAAIKRSAMRKAFSLVLGAAAAVSLGIPGAAQAATDTATMGSASPAVSPGNCFQDMYLVQVVNDFTDQINSSGRLYFADAEAHDLCQALVTAGGKEVVIYTSSGGDCLAYDASDNQVYQHNPTGCDTTGTPPSYEQWKFLLTFSQPGLSKQYEIQSLYNGQCLQYADNAVATLGACDGGSEFIVDNVF